MPSVIRQGVTALNRTVRGGLTAAEGLAGAQTFVAVSFKLKPGEAVLVQGIDGTMACNSTGDIDPSNRMDLVIFEDLEFTITQQYNGTIWSDNLFPASPKVRYYKRITTPLLAGSFEREFNSPLRLDEPKVYTLMLGFITGLAAPPGGYVFWLSTRGLFIPEEQVIEDYQSL